MLKDLKKHDFYRLKKVALDRLSPNRISGFLFVATIYSIITAMLPIIAVVFKGMYIPIYSSLTITNCILIIVQILMVIFYLIPFNYMKFQKSQAVMLSLFGIKMSIEAYLSFFLICVDSESPEYMITTGILALLLGLVFLILSTIRGFVRAKNGEFRREGKGLLNVSESKGYVSLPIIFGAVVLGNLILRTFSDFDINGVSFDVLFILFLCVLIQYSIAIALPEFFLLTYCKFRFGSFIIKK